MRKRRLVEVRLVVVGKHPTLGDDVRPELPKDVERRAGYSIAKQDKNTAVLAVDELSKDEEAAVSAQPSARVIF